MADLRLGRMGHVGGSARDDRLFVADLIRRDVVLLAREQLEEDVQRHAPS